jgi:hypothetical protein
MLAAINCIDRVHDFVRGIGKAQPLSILRRKVGSRLNFPWGTGTSQLSSGTIRDETMIIPVRDQRALSDFMEIKYGHDGERCARILVDDLDKQYHSSECQ